MRSMFISLLIFSIAFTGMKCCDKINEDNKKPLVTIDLIYKDSSGREVEKKYTTDMTQPENGFNVSVPKSAIYQLWVGASDPGCIKSMTLEKREGRMDAGNTWIDPAFTTISSFTGDLNCPKRNPTMNYNAPLHVDKFIVYICSAKDFGGSGSGVTIWVHYSD